MAVMGQGQFPAKGSARNLTVASVRFYCNNTSNPDSAYTTDPGDLVSTIVYSATGIQTITLKHRWKYIHAVAQALDTTGTVIAKVTATTAGRSSANTVVLQTESSGSAAALTNKYVDVLLFLYR